MASMTSSEILSRFPGVVALYPSRTKWVLILAGCLVFAVGGFLMIRDQQTAGWYVFVFFGLGAIVAVVVMLPSAASLKLDREGFEVTSLFRRHRTKWKDASEFSTAAIPPSNVVLVVYDEATVENYKLAQFSKKLTGHNAALGDTFGLAAEDLAELMNRWRGRALGRS
jgi:hypothetical protein